MKRSEVTYSPIAQENNNNQNNNIVELQPIIDLLNECIDKLEQKEKGKNHSVEYKGGSLEDYKATILANQQAFSFTVIQKPDVIFTNFKTFD